MKVLIIRNRYTKKLDWKKGVQYFDEKTPLKLEITETKTDFDFTFRTVGNATYSGVVVGGDYYQKLRSVVPEGVYDVVCLIYGNKAPGIRMNITENEFLYQNTAVIQVIKDSDGGLSFNHELFHVFFKKLASRGIVLHDPMDITFIKGEPKPYYNNKSLTAKESNRTIALETLAPYWDKLQEPIPGFFSQLMDKLTPKPHYLYFSEKEIIGLKPELVKMLDNARGIAGVPFKLNSGLRTVEQNKKAGGVSDSAHLTGTAVDIACPNDGARWKIITSLQKVGFTRIGIADTFVHCDIDKTKAQNVIWMYK